MKKNAKERNYDDYEGQYIEEDYLDEEGIELNNEYIYKPCKNKNDEMVKSNEMSGNDYITQLWLDGVI